MLSNSKAQIAATETTWIVPLWRGYPGGPPMSLVRRVSAAPPCRPHKIAKPETRALPLYHAFISHIQGIPPRWPQLSGNE